MRWPSGQPSNFSSIHSFMVPSLILKLETHIQVLKKKKKEKQRKKYPNTHDKEKVTPKRTSNLWILTKLRVLLGKLWRLIKINSNSWVSKRRFCRSRNEGDMCGTIIFPVVKQAIFKVVSNVTMPYWSEKSWCGYARKFKLRTNYKAVRRLQEYLYIFIEGSYFMGTRVTEREIRS